MRLGNIFFILMLVLAGTLFSCKPIHKSISEVRNSSDSLRSNQLLAERIFFMFAKEKENPGLEKMFTKNSFFQDFYSRKRQRISSAIDNCEQMKCLVNELMISNDEQEGIINSVSQLYHENDKALQHFIRNQIRPAHAYSFFENYTDSALFVEAWKNEIKGYNYIIKAYLLNEGMIYPKIDSSAFDVHSTKYRNDVIQVAEKAFSFHKPDFFFAPFINMSLSVLNINGRDEAARLYPLDNINKKAYDRIPEIDWSQYPYSGILIFGEGPTKQGVRISEGSKMRSKMGVSLFKEGKAPFLIVSGGYVHPFKTKFNEAEGMKQFLIDSLHIPEDAIIMEPHARHTTTNIRNTNRIFLSNFIPRNKPILGVTVKSHIDFIASQRIVNVFKRDLGFVTFAGLDRLSDTTVSFYPTMSSFQINPLDPLDP